MGEPPGSERDSTPKGRPTGRALACCQLAGPPQRPGDWWGRSPGGETRRGLPTRFGGGRSGPVEDPRKGRVQRSLSQPAKRVGKRRRTRRRPEGTK